MPDTVRDAPPTSSDGLLASLGRSFRAHLDRPVLLILVFGLTIAVFMLDHLTGTQTPGPRDLTKSFALPPLDVYSDLRLLRDTGARWAILIVLPIRVVVMGAYLVLLLRILLERKRLVRFAVVYFAALVSFAVPFVMSALYVRAYTSALTGGEIRALPMMLLLLSPIIHAVFALIFVQLLVRAIAGHGMQLKFGDRSLWGIAILSTWIWFSVAGKAGDLFGEFPAASFSVAFAALLAQSILVGAAALRIQLGFGNARRHDQGPGPGAQLRDDLDLSSQREHSNQRDVG